MESENVENMNIRITDFGFACFHKPGDGGLHDVLGSPLYMAPEIADEKEYSLKVDLWSVGVITYILLSGRPPFRGKSKEEIFQNVRTTDLSFDFTAFDKVSDNAKDFISRALQKDPELRATAEELLAHPWID